MSPAALHTSIFPKSWWVASPFFDYKLDGHLDIFLVNGAASGPDARGRSLTSPTTQMLHELHLLEGLK
jgi:hypothetical protein